jgi:hypothetical protein
LDCHCPVLADQRPIGRCPTIRPPEICETPLRDGLLHTDQQHPHVHLVVKAESELGRRLRIDKQTLRDWREAFARLMREQGIAANATPRAIRGENTKALGERVLKSQRYGTSAVIHDRVMRIAKELSRTGTIEDPARARLLQTRKSLVSTWIKAAEVLDAQGEVTLAGDVRYFAKHLPPVLSDRQRLAAQFLRFRQQSQKLDGPPQDQAPNHERTL